MKKFSVFEGRIKMKKYLIPFLLTGIVFLFCEKDLSPISPNPGKSVALNVGNLFYYSEYSSSQISDTAWAVSDWFRYDNIIGDTLILNKRYFILNHSTLRRADENKLYGFENNNEVTLLDFDVQIGDTVDFYNSRAIVEDIGKRQIFNRNQTIISVSSGQLYSDTLITGAYAAQFGLLAYSIAHGKNSDGSTLLGAVINGIQFGKIH
jgi:hypothetical protein